MCAVKHLGWGWHLGKKPEVGNETSVRSILERWSERRSCCQCEGLIKSPRFQTTHRFIQKDKPDILASVLESGGLDSEDRCWLQQKQEPGIPDSPTFILCFRRPTCTHSAARGIISITGEINLPSTSSTECLKPRVPNGSEGISPASAQRADLTKMTTHDENMRLKKKNIYKKTKATLVSNPQVSFIRRRIGHKTGLKMIIWDGMGFIFSLFVFFFLSFISPYFHLSRFQVFIFSFNF